MPNLLPFEKKECMLVFRCVRLQPPALTDQSNRLPPPTAVFLSSSAGLPYISFSALFPRGCPKDKVHCHEAPLLCHDGLSQFYDGAPWHGSTSYRSGMTVLWDVTSYRDIAPLTHPLRLSGGCARRRRRRGRKRLAGLGMCRSRAAELPCPWCAASVAAWEGG